MYYVWFFCYFATACFLGKYGVNCVTDCGHCSADGESCDGVTGICPGGCEPGYKGDMCDTGNIKTLICFLTFLNINKLEMFQLYYISFINKF